MEGKLLKICLALAMAACVNACDSGSHNDLECDDTYVSECLAANVSMVCKDGKLVKLECGQGEACSQVEETLADGKVVSKGVCRAVAAACTDGAVQCAADGSKLQNCVSGAWVDGTACPNGCENNACKDAPVDDKCTDGAVQCAADGSKLQNCVSGAWVDGTACPNGCENNACKDAPVEGACDETFVESCNEKGEVVYCDGGVVTAAACKEGYTCLTVKDGNYANCFTDEDICETKGEVEAYCDSENYSYDAQVKLECSEMSDGSLRTVFTGEYCDISCNEEGTACVAVADPSDPTKCSADAIATCAEEEYAGCALRDGHLACYDTTCTAAEAGKTANPTCSDFLGFIYYSTVDTCVAADNGTYIYVTETEYCEGVCNEEGTACAEVEACDDTYVESCDGQVLKYCSDGMVSSINCGEYEGYTCLTVKDQNFADCFDTASECSKKGDSVKACVDDWYYSYEYTQVCSETSDGKLHYVVDSEAKPLYCDASCNDDKTACAEVEKCDDTYVESCDGQVLKYCSDGIVDTIDCGSVAGYTCLTVKDGNYADCFTEEDKCSKKGEEESYCDSENYSHDAFVSYVCSEMSDGSLRNVMSDGYYCLNEDETDYTSCNAAGTACE